MFRASLGQLSDFPRSVDFLATVRIETRGRAHIIGEPLIVKYSYIHDDDVIDTEHSLDSLGFRGPRCQPHSSCDWIGLTVVLPGQDGTLPPSSAAGKHSADGRACLNGNIDFGDCVGEPHCRHTEKLLAWCIVPEPNTGSITFSGSPSIPGPYRVRYFLHGSQVSIGNVVDVVAEFVKCELSIPPEIMLGDVLPVSYKLNYQQDSDRTGSDWVGLFVVPDSAAVSAFPEYLSFLRFLS